MSKVGLDLLFKQFPIVETEDLKLREVTSADVAALFSIFSDAEVVQFYDLDAFTHHSQAAEMIGRWRRRFHNGQAVRWGITQAGRGEVIGTVGLHVQSELF